MTIRGFDGRDDIVNGTDDGEALAGLTGADTMIGGLGDDWYYVDNAKDVVDEKPDEGIDTVISYLPTYVLADNVENLILSGSANKSGYGNDLANIIRGHAGNNILDGGAGDDLLYGGGSNDVFVIRAGNGSDAIGDFVAGPANASVVSLVGYSFTSFDQVKAAMTQDGDAAVLDLGNGETLRFLGQSVDNFDAEDFDFGVDKSKWTLTFNDDFDTFERFNGVDGTWTTRFPRDGFSGYANPTRSEQQIYVDSDFSGIPVRPAPESLGLNPFSVGDGALTITPGKTPTDDLYWTYNRQYYSGMISTYSSFQQTYGYFEIRAKMPNGQSLWPAFWLLPVDQGAITELDVVETLGQNPFNSLVAVHSGETGKRVAQSFLSLTQDLSADFHTFGMDWGPKTITWYLDGVAVGTSATPTDLQNRSMYMIANLAVGGNWAGSPDATTLAGDPTLKIDYIRAYATENTLPPHGNRRVRAGAPGVPDDILGTALDDVLSGDEQNDKISGAAGNDILSGGADNDTLSGGAGDDRLDGGTGIDIALYNGEASRFVVVRNLDTDVYTVTDTGSVGNQGTDSLTGIETLRFQRIDDVTGVNLGVTDVAITDAVDATIRTTKDGIRVLTFGDTQLLPYLPSSPGIDTIEYTGGKGTFHLPDGYENLITAGGILIGNAAANILVGGAGADRLDGGAGDDTLDGGAGADVLIGGDGFNTASYASALAGVTADLTNAANNTGDAAGDRYSRIFGLTGSAFQDSLTGSASGDVIKGGAGADTLSGLGGADRLLGGDGDDLLLGGASNDTLDGGADADRLVGGTGYDRLTGGAGADTFVFSLAEGWTSADTVTDFTSGVDKLEIKLSDVVDPSQLASVQLLTGAAAPASAPAAALFYETNTGRLLWEPGGPASGNVLLATLSGNPTLTAGDISIV